MNFVVPSQGCSTEEGDPERIWLRVSSSPLDEGDRLHVCLEGRYVTVFKYDAKLSAIDSICHHAGGPLTNGGIEDIEDLGVKAVSCPWHHFLVSIEDGRNIYKSIEFREGKPVPSG